MVRKDQNWEQINPTNKCCLCVITAPMLLLEKQKWATLLHRLRGAFIIVNMALQFILSLFPCFQKISQNNISITTEEARDLREKLGYDLLVKHI